MKIKANKDFTDRKTKNTIKAGTEVEADKKRLDILKKNGIKYEVTSEKPKPSNKTSTKAKETRGDEVKK